MPVAQALGLGCSSAPIHRSPMLLKTAAKQALPKTRGALAGAPGWDKGWTRHRWSSRQSLSFSHGGTQIGCRKESGVPPSATVAWLRDKFRHTLPDGQATPSHVLVQSPFANEPGHAPSLPGVSAPHRQNRSFLHWPFSRQGAPTSPADTTMWPVWLLVPPGPDTAKDTQ